MKKLRILITGGAGFIGSFLTDVLIDRGCTVRIFDNLDHQVHQGKKPSYLNKKAEFIRGDVRDKTALEMALEETDIMFHLASRVGVAQSNYEIRDYADVNVGGMANLLDIVVNNKMPVKKIIMTASMTSYGEGLYECRNCGKVKPLLREKIQVKRNDWELHCPTCQKILLPIPTPENTDLANNSIYSLTKNVQEQMLMLVGKMYGIPAVSLRCFNVYGPRQSLSNPYTGVAAIFISRLKNNQPPVIYEDGQQTRDFVSVHDVVNALIKAMESDKAEGEVFNIGSGSPAKIIDVAHMLAMLLKKEIASIISGQFRKNDIRHCFADISKGKRLLGWQPSVSLEDGLAELIAWSNHEKAVDSFEKAEKILRTKKLL